MAKATFEFVIFPLKKKTKESTFEFSSLMTNESCTKVNFFSFLAGGCFSRAIRHKVFITIFYSTTKFNYT
jgi:hypothetical protein